MPATKILDAGCFAKDRLSARTASQITAALTWERQRVQYGDLGKELLRLTDETEGKICIIGPKARRLNTAVETILVKRGYRLLEANDLTVLGILSSLSQMERRVKRPMRHLNSFACSRRSGPGYKDFHCQRPQR